MDKKFKYLFGPVPSRRLGMSLGVDLVPSKVCSLNCVYCEVGDTTKLTTNRMEYIPYKKIEQELTAYFEANPAPDYITFSGYGEPTLNRAIGKIIHHIKTTRPAIPVALLTNGTLFSVPEVRSELLGADLILPSLDAATQTVFEKINLPASGLQVEDHIRGLIDFRQEFKGQIWLEVFILPGYNDSDDELEALRKAIVQIRADRVQLNTLDRPGRVAGLHPASLEQLQQIVDKWSMANLEIVAKAADRSTLQAYRSDVESAILETIDRRPCTANDLAQTLGTHINEINKYLDTLEKDQKIFPVRDHRGIFYKKKNQPG